jgi:hypothetical protein
MGLGLLPFSVVARFHFIYLTAAHASPSAPGDVISTGTPAGVGLGM